MKVNFRRHNGGAILIFALIAVLLMAIAGSGVMRTGIFQARMSANNHLDALAFEATESVIAATLSKISESPAMRNALMAGKPLTTCVKNNDLNVDACDDSAFPAASAVETAPARPTATLANQAVTEYQGAAPVAGFDVAILVNHRFATEGRAYYVGDSAPPFGHLNAQVWQTLGTPSGVLNQ